MSSNPGAQTPREVLAQSAVKSANNGELTYTNYYKLQHSSSNFRITVPLVFLENTGFQKSHVAGVYASFDEGILVYDFQKRTDEYDRGKRGNGHVVE